MQRAFSRMPESVQAARRFMAEALSGSPEDLVDRAMLIVSELATNAIQQRRADS